MTSVHMYNKPYKVRYLCEKCGATHGTAENAGYCCSEISQVYGCIHCGNTYRLRIDAMHCCGFRKESSKTAEVSILEDNHICERCGDAIRFENPCYCSQCWSRLIDETLDTQKTQGVW